MIKRIAILTGGGDCPGLNAVIRAVVKTAQFEHGFEVWGIEDGFKGLIDNRIRFLKSKDVSGILPHGGTILGTSNKDDPFRVFVKENGNVVTRDLSDKCVKHLSDLQIDALIVIGGDGTLKIGQRLYKEKGVNIVAVPKTIDNDLDSTDFTFGFDSALITATQAIDNLHTTADAHHRVMVVEVMGRYAGWIALYAGIAGGSDIILIPEIPYKYESIVTKLKERQNEGKRFSIVVVAEGAKPIGGEMVTKRIIPTSPDRVRLGGIANVVADKIEELTDIETRVTVLGHLLRGGNASPFDRILGTRFGCHALKLVKESKWGNMVSLSGNKITEVPIEKAVDKLKLVNPDGDLVKTALQVGTNLGFSSK